jgi:hypothetical protein
MSGEPLSSFECAHGGLLLRPDWIIGSKAVISDWVLAEVVVSVRCLPEQAIDFNLKIRFHFRFPLHHWRNQKRARCVFPVAGHYFASNGEYVVVRSSAAGDCTM